MVGVLHTWTRGMAYHPHIHSLVPGGALATDGSTWLAPRSADWLVPVHALSILFRGKFQQALPPTGLLARMSPHTTGRISMWRSSRACGPMSRAPSSGGMSISSIGRSRCGKDGWARSRGCPRPRRASGILRCSSRSMNCSGPIGQRRACPTSMSSSISTVGPSRSRRSAGGFWYPACVPCMRSCLGVKVPRPGVRGAEGQGKRKGIVVRQCLKAAWNERAGRGTQTGYKVWYARGELARDSKALHPQLGRALYTGRLRTDGMTAYHGRPLRCPGTWRATETG